MKNESLSSTIKQVECKTISATVRFGLITEQCRGKGICSVTVREPELHIPKQGTAFAEIHIDINNKVTFSFEKSLMSQCIKEKFFSSEFFLMEEPFKIPKSIVKIFQLEEYLIKKGTYFKIETKGFYYLIF